MQISKSKTAAISIAIFLMLSMGASMMLVPNANAHTPAWQVTTYAWVTASPNPVGVGQQMLIFGLLDTVINGALVNNNIRFNNYQFTITKPDGTTVTQSFPIVTDSTGAQYFTYTPDQVGNYTVFFSYPGQVYNYGGTYQGDYYTPSNATTTFTVQSQPVAGFTEVPLPTNYWTRPINGQNVLWDSIGSNWLGGAATANYWQQNGAAPTSAHIMWTKPLELGGLTGGIITQAGNSAQSNDTAATYYSGFSYNTRFGNPIILNGVLYYQQPKGEAGSGGGEFAVDLTTGQTLWSSDSIVFSKAQLYDLQSPDQHGVVGGILWVVSGTTWIGYNAFTRQPIFNLTNVPSGTEVYLNNGEIDRYVFSYNQAKNTGWLALWNETAVILNAQLLYGAPYGWPTGSNLVIDASTPTAYTYNVTITANLNGTAAPSIVGVIPGNVILGASSSLALASQPNPNTNPWTMWALSDKPNTQGNLSWIQNYAAPAGNITEMLCTQPIDPVTNEWTMQTLETGQRYAYSLATGNLVWGPSAVPLTGFQYYSDREGFPAYGNLYVSGYGGIVYCYSMLNGTLLWTYGNGGEGNSTNTGANTPWGNYPTHVCALADGIVYTMAGEHSPNTPLYRGYVARAIDAFTGQELWTLPDWSASGLGTSIAPVAIADGYMVFANAYDGQIYCVGQGPSDTTVSIQNNVISQGNTVLIQGTVTDVSAGTQQTAQAADFPNGVPVASDASMSAWMSCVYQQQPMPTNFTGVPVTIDVLDSNGNYRNIGTATTTSSGTYSLAWTPDIAGNYTVIATFHGNNGYYGSYSQTAFYVMNAPAATTAPTPTPQSVADMYFVPAIAGLLVAIIVVGAVVILMLRLMLRKRP
jgi:hypothetical protein